MQPIVVVSGMVEIEGKEDYFSFYTFFKFVFIFFRYGYNPSLIKNNKIKPVIKFFPLMSFKIQIW